MASPTVEPGRASSGTPSKLAALQGRSATPKSASGQTPPAKLDDDTIEDIIQRATASAGAGPPPGKDTRTQLFVGNLPYRVRWQDLKDLFRKAGTVLRADVSLGPDNRSRGYGTVLLATAEDAGKATDMYNGYVWQNRTLEVRPDRLPPEFDMGLNHTNPPTIPTSAPISNPMVPLAVPQPGHALDPLSRPMSAAMSGQDVPAPSPGFFAPSPFGPGSTNWPNSGFQTAAASNRQLFIGNLPFQCQWQDLKDLFRTAGQILRADVALGPDGRSRGFGTVVYAKETDAARAVSMFNGYDYNGRILKVHYDRYSPTNQSGSLSPNSMHAVATGPLGIMVPSLQTDISVTNHPAGGMHLAMPQTPEYILFPPHSQPASPYDQYPPMGVSQMHAMMGAFDRSGLSLPPGGRGALDNTAPSDPGSPRYGGSPQMAPGSNPHPHPGPITLPPVGVGQFPPASALSPLLTRAGGLPPMTPSMPGFNFNPQTVATPPLHAHFLSPGLGPFSPQLHSPTFVPSGPGNPYLNPAPGAPPRLPNAPGLFDNGPGAFGMHPAPSSGYFPPPPDSGYFSGVPVNGAEQIERGDEPGSFENPPRGGTPTSFDVSEGLALQLRDVKLDEGSIPISGEILSRPSLGPSRTSLPEVSKSQGENADSALGLTPPDDEGASVLGLGLGGSRGQAGPLPIRTKLAEESVFGPVGSGDRRASWNASTSRVRAGVKAPVP